jgi:hypothetical protein
MVKSERASYLRREKTRENAAVSCLPEAFKENYPEKESAGWGNYYIQTVAYH